MQCFPVFVSGFRSGCIGPAHFFLTLPCDPELAGARHGITTVVSTQPVHTQQQQRRIMPTPEEVVTAFCKAADANDLDGMLALW